MTRADIVEQVHSKLGLSKQDSARIVEETFEIIKEAVEQGEKVKISGFGNFTVRVKRPRIGRNPHTKEEIMIEGRTVLTFKASQILKTRVNKAPGITELDTGKPEA